MLNRWRFALLVGAIVACVGVQARAGDIDLGTADSFAVFGAAGVTNTGSTTINGDLGAEPTGTYIDSGSTTLNGSIHLADATAASAHSAAQTAYSEMLSYSGTTTDMTGQDLGPSTGLILSPGIYTFSSSAQLTGALTLDGAGLYIFRVATQLTTGSGSSVNLTGGADACNIYWAIGSQAAFGSTTTFAGTVIANSAAITFGNGVTLTGHAFALTAAVTMIGDTINTPACDTNGGGTNGGGALIVPLPASGPLGLALLGVLAFSAWVKRRRISAASY